MAAPDQLQVPEPLQGALTATAARRRSTRVREEAGVDASTQARHGRSAGHGPTFTITSDDDITPAVVQLVRNALAHEARLTTLADRIGRPVEWVLALLERRSSSAELTASELEALQAANIDLSGPEEGAAGVLFEGAAAAATLLSQAFTVEGAAQRLRVSQGRVRQRISDGQLIAIRQPDGYRLPAWQFHGDSVVPGLTEIAAATEHMHPLSLQQFMTTPNVDLLIGDEPATPVLWLITGGSPRAVNELLTGPRG